MMMKNKHDFQHPSKQPGKGQSRYPGGKIGIWVVFCLLILVCRDVSGQKSTAGKERIPNILFVISDDQSYPYASAYGDKAVKTPAFDRVAKEGILFTNAFSASPGCSPSRAALLTGRNCWQLKEAGTHASSFPAELKTYPDILEESGYYIGFTGKGWGPGNFEISGRTRNPAGPAFNQETMDAPRNISKVDYTANFKKFLGSRPKGKPFCFWFGAQEPHRGFPTGAGKESGIETDRIKVPAFLPDHPDVRSDMADYFFEIQWFDRHLGQMLEALEAIGELDNTLIVVTSDNGMPFPKAKANVYEYGIHMPLAIMWKNSMNGNRTVADPVSLIDVFPTFLEAARVAYDKKEIAGKSLMNILKSRKEEIVDKSREAVYASRERHSSSRWNNLGYPQRCIRTRTHLYIRNFKPDLWPAGDPRVYGADGTLGPEDSGYFDIDDFKDSYIFRHRADPDIAPYFNAAVGKRPAEELYDIVADPACLHNLAAAPEYQDLKNKLSRKLSDYLLKTNDPRMGDNGDIFETYKRYSPMRDFPPHKK